MLCPSCGNELPDGAAFCDICGAKLNTVENVGQSAPLQETPVEQSVPQQGTPMAQPVQPQSMPQQGTPMGQPMPQQGTPMGQPMPQQGMPMGQSIPPQGGGYQTPQKKSPLVPILIAVVTVLVIGIAVLCIFLFGGKGGKNDNPAASPAVEKTATPTEEPKAEPKEEPTPEPKEEPTPEPEPEPVGESPEETAEKYSTDDRPNVGDFEWFYTLYYDSKPAKAIKGFFSQGGATEIDDPALVEGGWKAYMTGKQDEFHEEGYRYLNVIIKNNDDNTKAQVTLDWWTMGDGTGDETDESGEGDSKYTCKWNGARTSFSDGQLKMDEFIEMDDVQYAIGTYMWESGEVDYIVLVREKTF